MAPYAGDCDISELVGKTFDEVTNVDDERINFIGSLNCGYTMYHDQDCCESVRLEDVCGDLQDLVGTPILSAYEDTNEDCPKLNDWDDSYTWTFYRLATIKGTVTLRWYGTSNGYYSESVVLYRTQPQPTRDIKKVKQQKLCI